MSTRPMNTETLEQWFRHTDTPSAGSPTGLTMVELLKLQPAMTFDEARAWVNQVGASLYSSKECAKRVVELIDMAQAA